MSSLRLTARLRKRWRFSKSSFIAETNRSSSSCDATGTDVNSTNRQPLEEHELYLMKPRNQTSPPITSDASNLLTWYSCGPTVYDAAHIGHARTYVCTDIIRRILTDIHHKDVNFAMGMTDIDDKIIERAAAKGLKNWPQTELMVRGLEEDFFEDLDSLNVRRPDAVLRVTEHLPEIISYIEGIMVTGRSYVTPDGVYFSVESCGNSYLQFKDPGTTDSADPNVSPPVMTVNQNSFTLPPLGFKKDRRDFALWKTVKTGEPFWDSPWGPGRPGWHIECSAMTNSYFGSKLDIHSGGIDLQFPHHTNEIAQCSAYNCIAPSEWVKFWIHTGHLYIEGRKMSKSLKNFITIQDYLQGAYSLSPAIDFRIFCLQYKYHSSVHFSQIRIDEAGSFRRKMENYLKISGAILSAVKCADSDVKGRISSSQQLSDGVSNIAVSKPTQESMSLRKALSTCQRSVRLALANDFDTPEVIKLISYLIGDAITFASLINRNLSSPDEQISQISSAIEKIKLVPIQPTEPLLAVNYYLLDLMGKLGVDFKVQKYPKAVATVVPSFLNRNQSITETAILESLLAFRSKVRSSSLNCIKGIKSDERRRKKDLEGSKATDPVLETAKIALEDVLTSCDSVRLSIGQELGLQIEDYGDVSIWRHSETIKRGTDICEVSPGICPEEDLKSK